MSSFQNNNFINYGTIYHECNNCGIVPFNMCKRNISQCRLLNKLVLFNLFRCSNCGMCQMIRLFEKDMTLNDELKKLMNNIENE